MSSVVCRKCKKARPVFGMECDACYVPPEGRMTRAQPFWAHVDRSGGPDACWPWNGELHKYASFTEDGYRTVPAHRYAFESTGAVLPDGASVDHQCSHRGCQNPAHLNATTPAENTRRGQARKKGFLTGLRFGAALACEATGTHAFDATLVEKGLRVSRPSERATSEAVRAIRAGHAIAGPCYRLVGIDGRPMRVPA